MRTHLNRNRVFDQTKLQAIEKDLQHSIEEESKKNKNPPSNEEKIIDSILQHFATRVNGCGISLIGKRDVREDGTYVTTAWFSWLWIPLLPLRSFRIISSKRLLDS